ncbi:MAG: 2,3-bisphosphoglycerate-independent phosphoglycerate mutase [Pseudomonadota bacterium]
MAPKPVVLCILDGWGVAPDGPGNAVTRAETPAFDRAMAGPSATLTTFGPEVGLPEGQMGNSEVGHMNIGAGRVVEMDLMRINGVIAQGALGQVAPLTRLTQAMGDARVRNPGAKLHLMGVLSDGGVHAHIEHMIAVARHLTQAGVAVVIHAFTDGRDVTPGSAAGYARHLTDALPKVPVATVSGRYYALDRDNRWDRVARAYAAIVHADAPRADDIHGVITREADAGRGDEFIHPHVLGAYGGMAPGDGVLFLNFRADRARQILAALGDPDFSAFDTGSAAGTARPGLGPMAGFTSYSDRHDTYMDTIFPEDRLRNTLGAWVAAQGRRQFRIAETEKYPHVTFFINGGEETPNLGEDRYLAPSPQVATYDLAPEMSAPEVTEHLVAAVDEGYDLIIVNYANPDMVGHTGDMAAATRAVAEVDRGLAALFPAVENAGGAILMIADHGNCECMTDPATGAPHTAHTVNPVPVALIGGPNGAKIRSGRLADVAPTVLELMGLPIPQEMTGRSLIE